MSGYNQSNPYHSPPVIQESKPSDSAVSTRTVLFLQRTRPWVLFLGVMFFICCGFFFLGAMMALAGTAQLAGTGFEGFGLWAVVFYGLFGFIYLICGISCVRYGSRIRQFMYDRSTARLDSALEAQMLTWRLFGIITIVAISLGVLMGILSVSLTTATPRHQGYGF